MPLFNKTPTAPRPQTQTGHGTPLSKVFGSRSPRSKHTRRAETRDVGGTLPLLSDAPGGRSVPSGFANRSGRDMAAAVIAKNPAYSQSAVIAASGLIGDIVGELPKEIYSPIDNSMMPMPMELQYPLGLDYREYDLDYVMARVVIQLIFAGRAFLGIRRVAGRFAGFYLCDPRATYSFTEGGRRKFHVSASGGDLGDIGGIVGFGNEGLAQDEVVELMGYGLTFPAKDMIAISGGVQNPHTLNGIAGVDYAATSVDTAMHVDQATREHFELFAHTSEAIGLKIDTNVSEAEKVFEDLLDDLEGPVRGETKTFPIDKPNQELHKVDIGLPPEKWNTSPIKSYHQTDIAAVMRIPLAIIGSSIGGANSYNNVLALRAIFVTTQLSPLLHRIAKAMDFRVVPAGGKFRFDLAEASRGDRQSAVKTANDMSKGNYAYVDDARIEAGLDPLPDGKGQKILVPGQLLPYDVVAERTDNTEAAQSPKPKEEPNRPTEQA